MVDFICRDDEIVYASKGEDFIPLLNSNNSEAANEGASGKLVVERQQQVNDWVKLNVGGQLFYTSRTTLLNREPCSMLAKMFDPDSGMQPGTTDSEGAYLIDRDPVYFRPLLNYLRDGELIIDPDVNVKGMASVSLSILMTLENKSNYYSFCLKEF